MNFLLQVRSYLTTHVREIVRFVVVGISIFLINFLTFAFVHYKIGLDYPAAATAGYGVGIICHFTLNKLFTFEAGTQVLAQNLPRYALMLAFNYGITLVAFWLTVRIIAAPAHFGVVVASASTAFASFFVMKYFVFQPASAGGARSGMTRRQASPKRLTSTVMLSPRKTSQRVTSPSRQKRKSSDWRPIFRSRNVMSGSQAGRTGSI